MTCATLKVATPKIFSPGNYAVNYIWAVRINFVCWLFICPPYKRKGSRPSVLQENYNGMVLTMLYCRHFSDLSLCYNLE